MLFKIYDKQNLPTQSEFDTVTKFLFEHLEQFGDDHSAIAKCADFALGRGDNSLGGFILTAEKDDQLAGVVIMNRTGMSEYIPDNILVYIATHRSLRGQGVGTALMKKAIELSDGPVALHVEPDNPALKLYEKLGFTNKYLEMRLTK